MLVLSACKDVDVLNLLVYIKLVIDILKIVAPVILIIMASIDVLKAVSANDQDGIQKNIKKIPSRLLICAIIYLLPTTFFWAVDIVQKKNDIASCLSKATPAYVAGAYQDAAMAAIESAEKSPSQATYNTALAAVNKVSDKDVKKSFEKRLTKLEKNIKENEKVNLNVDLPDNNPGGASTTPGASGDSPDLSNTSPAEIEETDSKIANEAQKYQGLPYRYGTENLNVSVDCSGFTQQIFKKFGITLPRTADSQAKSTAIVINGLANAKPGDLLFYDWDNNGRYDHVAIYIGNNERVHASGGPSCPDPKKLCKVVKDSKCMNSIKLIKRFVKD